MNFSQLHKRLVEKAMKGKHVSDDVSVAIAGSIKYTPHGQEGHTLLEIVTIQSKLIEAMQNQGKGEEPKPEAIPV